jgi:hypothetical protein
LRVQGTASAPRAGRRGRRGGGGGRGADAVREVPAGTPPACCEPPCEGLPPHGKQRFALAPGSASACCCRLVRQVQREVFPAERLPAAGRRGGSDRKPPLPGGGVQRCERRGGEAAREQRAHRPLRSQTRPFSHAICRPPPHSWKSALLLPAAVREWLALQPCNMSTTTTTTVTPGQSLQQPRKQPLP